MNYCEDCHLLCAEKRCPICGTKKLRPVENNDFCFFIELPVLRAQMFCGALTDQCIENVSFPVLGAGLTSRFGMVLEQHRVFVPYASLSDAEEILLALFGEEIRYQ